MLFFDLFIAAFKLSPAGLASVIGRMVTLSSLLGFEIWTHLSYIVLICIHDRVESDSKKKNVLISFLENIRILACRKIVYPLNTRFKQCWGSSLVGWVTIKNIESGFIHKYFIETSFGIEMLNCLLHWIDSSFKK